MARIHGAASAGENLSGNINFYTMYVSGIDITATGSVADQTQQNFDDVCNVINLVAQPIIMNNADPSIQRPPPGKGEHSREILAEYGYSDAEIDAFANKGVI